MKTNVNISGIEVAVLEQVLKLADAEFRGNKSAAFCALIKEALAAREKGNSNETKNTLQ